jgi:hypothetical protein
MYRFNHLKSERLNDDFTKLKMIICVISNTNQIQRLAFGKKIPLFKFTALRFLNKCYIFVFLLRDFIKILKQNDM